MSGFTPDKLSGVYRDFAVLISESVHNGFLASNLASIVFDLGQKDLLFGLEDYVSLVLIGLAGDEQLYQVYQRERERLAEPAGNNSGIALAKMQTGDAALFKGFFDRNGLIHVAAEISNAYSGVASHLRRAVGAEDELKVFLFLAYNPNHVFEGLAYVRNELKILPQQPHVGAPQNLAAYTNDRRN